MDLRGHRLTLWFLTSAGFGETLNESYFDDDRILAMALMFRINADQNFADYLEQHDDQQ